MGLSLNEAFLLADWTARHGLRGHVATLGVPTLHFTTADMDRLLRAPSPSADGAARPHATEFYRRLGFDRASYLDLSDYEGAEIILDLGTPELPAHLRGAFDLVFDCGTLEHVFHLPNALGNVVRMAAPGGHVLHLVLMDNGVDHGFYQFSPTLFFDWFEAAGLEVLEAAALRFDAVDFAASTWSVRPVRRGSFGAGELGLAGGRTSLFMVLARKTAEIAAAPSPIQHFYRRGAGPGRVQPRWFPAFQLRAGEAGGAGNATRLPLEGFMLEGGFAWRCALPPAVPEGSSGARRCASDLLLLEDGRPLGPLNWPHALIAAEGQGAYSHWGRSLVFSTSDNSSPLANGRCYEALFAGGAATDQGA